MLLKIISKSEKRMINKILNMCMKLNEIQDTYVYNFCSSVKISVYKWHLEEGVTDLDNGKLYLKDIYLEERPQGLKDLIEVLKGEFKKYERDRYTK